MSCTRSVFSSWLLFLSFSLICFNISSAAEDVPAFNTQVRTIGELIQQDNLSLAQAGIDQFWAEHHTEKGFVDAARRIKDTYWAEGDYAEYFALCERIVQAFPTDPLSIGIQVDIVTGYIKLKDLAKASEKLEQFWSCYRSDDRFVDFARRIKNAYWQTGEHAAHYAVCERIIKEFPDHPLTVKTCADEINGYIEDKELARASEKLGQFWATQKSKEGFVEAVRRVKDYYWVKGEHADHYALCERLIREFPDHPLTVTTRADEIIGYIEDKERNKTSEKLEQFWAHDHSDERFVEYAYKIKSAYWRAGDHATHFAVCDRILHEFPDHPLVVKTCGDAIAGYVIDNDLAAAEVGIETLFSRYTIPADIFLKSVAHIQKSCRSINDHSLAIEIGNRALATNSSDENALWVYQNVIISYVDVNAVDQADATFGGLPDKYSTHPDWAGFLNGLADYYRHAKYYPRSIELYQTALAQNPADDEKVEAYAGMAKAMVHAENTTADPNSPAVRSGEVDSIVQLLMTDHKDVKRLGFHIFQIAEEYYFRGEEAKRTGNRQQMQEDFLKAVKIWQNNINQIADSHHRCLAYYYAAVAYQELNDSEQALGCYEQVVNNWPDYEKAWYAQYMIAKYYEKLAEQGKATTEDVRDAYQTLLQRYPQSSAAQTARRKLDTL